MNNNNNIAFLIERFGERGGTERVTSAVMNALSHRGYSVKLLEVFPTNKNPFVLDSNIKTDILLQDPDHTIWPEGKKAKIRIYFKILKKLVIYLKKERIRILVFSSTHHAYYASLAAKLCNVRTISWEHFNCRAISNYKPLTIGRYLSARFSDYIVTLTEQDKTLWERDYLLKSNITSIPNIITNYKNANYEKREKIVISCGRITHQKGFDLLLNVWEKVSSDPRSDGWQLIIRGSGAEGEFGQSLFNTIKNRDIKNIHILPSITEIENEYKKASIYVGSSRYEGFHLSLAEAASASLPLVSFDCLCGPRDIISEGENGYLVHVGDIDGMAEKILLLMGDEDQRSIMAKASKNRSSLFYEDSVISRWQNLVDGIFLKTNRN